MVMNNNISHRVIIDVPSGTVSVVDHVLDIPQNSLWSHFLNISLRNASGVTNYFHLSEDTTASVKYKVSTVQENNDVLEVDCEDDVLIKNAFRGELEYAISPVLLSHIGRHTVTLVLKSDTSVIKLPIVITVYKSYDGPEERQLKVLTIAEYDEIISKIQDLTNKVAELESKIK